MSRLDELIAELCPDGVEYKTLDQIAENCDNLRKPITSGKRIGGEYPYYGASGIVDYVSSYIFEGEYLLVSEDGANLVARSTPIAFSIFGKNWVNNHAHVLKFDNSITRQYVEYFFNALDLTPYITGAAQPKLNKKNLNSIPIPYPPCPVQEEIVQLLNRLSESINELKNSLTAELTARKQQYEYYRNLLIEKTEGIQGILLDMLAQPITDGPHTTPKLYETGVPFVSATAVYDGKVHLSDMKGYISNEFDEECAKKYKPRRNDVFMVKSGSTTGKVAIVDFDDDFNVWSPLAAMRTNDNCSPRYLYHLLQTTDIQNQVVERMSHGSQPNLSMRVLEQFDVKIPTLEVQNEVAEFLDKMDVICSGFFSGLSAEIEARQRQYEYYRDKLLTFKQLA